jgi:hypothetical protein|tara:strand:- start:7092 stop:7274 length:183 start_codon:yes stop_codon:yes gene_type:complete
MKAEDLDHLTPKKDKEYKMDPKYVLLVDNGTYADNSLVGLFWTVIKHRFHHWNKGEGWID